MFYVKTTKSGELTYLAVAGRGRAVRTSTGDVCLLQSLTMAQAVAKIFRDYRVLGS